MIVSEWTEISLIEHDLSFFITSNEVTFQMGSSDERAVLQLEDENLVRLEHFDRKASSLGTAPQRSSYDLEADDDSHKSIL